MCLCGVAEQIIGIENISTTSKSVCLLPRRYLLIFPGIDSILFDAEERLIHDHVARLLAAFRFATVIVIVEANSDFRWSARLCQVMTRDFGQRVKFVCSWKDPEKQNIGVQTGKREQFSAALLRERTVPRQHGHVLGDGFFSARPPRN